MCMFVALGFDFQDRGMRVFFRFGSVLLQHLYFLPQLS